MDDRPFVPETQPLDPEVKVISAYLGSCPKKEDHKHYVALEDLKTDHLPDRWRSECVVHDLKMVAKRVVHITVIKASPRRPNNYEQTGSGFITFNPKYGAIINTSKHVVFDPFEADHTIIRLFFDDDDNAEDVELTMHEMRKHILKSSLHSVYSYAKSRVLPPSDQCETKKYAELFLFRGSSRYFKSVMCSDFTAFTCEGLTVDKVFSKNEIVHSDAAFSWWKFSLKRLVFSAAHQDIDVAVIAHPHGGPKKISFGKMHRLLSLHPSLYSAPTCKGSSGGPVIRLHSHSAHYISAGQFVHHGHWKEKLDMGMGTVRPPVVLPYWNKLDTQTSLANAVSILYEPVFYWTLVVCDFLHIESTLHSSCDVFAYTSSFSGLLLSVDSALFKILNCGFWLHILCTFILRCRRSSILYAVCATTATLISMSMFLVGWILLYALPWTFQNVMLVIAAWLLVLYLERYYYWSSRFRRKTLGSFPEQLHYRLAIERKIQAKNVKSKDLVTTEETVKNKSI